jgi:hypothetical protein
MAGARFGCPFCSPTHHSSRQLPARLDSRLRSSLVVGYKCRVPSGDHCVPRVVQKSSQRCLRVTPLRADGSPSADQSEGEKEHRRGEGRCQEVGVTESEREGGGEHKNRAQSLAEAQNGTVERDKGAAVLIGGGFVE